MLEGTLGHVFGLIRHYGFALLKANAVMEEPVPRACERIQPLKRPSQFGGQRLSARRVEASDEVLGVLDPSPGEQHLGIAFG